MRWLLTALLALCVTSAAHGQCGGWLPGEGFPGPDGNVYALTIWDPDGPGPASTKVVIAGEFTIAGDVLANNIATFDLETGAWSALGEGVNGHVSALATLPDGELIAAGWFNTAGGVPAARIARWDGTSWAALGSGVDDHVECLVALPNGDLIAGGLFTSAGGVPANRIARWSGEAWSAVGDGVNDAVYALAALPNGDFVVGGAFTAAGGAPASYVARFDAATSGWMPMGAELNGIVRSVAVVADGTIYAGGDLYVRGENGDAGHIARWNGTAWSGFAFPFSYPVLAMAALPDGDLLAGNLGEIARWDGSAWTRLSGDDESTRCSALAVSESGEIVAGGNFHNSISVPFSSFRVARRDGDVWRPLSSGFNAGINAIALHPTGDLIAGGEFTSAPDDPKRSVARWDGVSWSGLGAGVRGTVFAVATSPHGDVYASHQFVDTSHGLVLRRAISRWDGVSWQLIAFGLDGNASSLVVMPNGDLIAAGFFTSINALLANRIARWDGTSWSTLGSGLNASVSALALLPNGDLAAAGWFTTAGGQPANYVARWSGSAWSALGSGVNSGVAKLIVLDNGDLIVAGRFSIAGGTPAYHIARWRDSAWSSMGFPFDLGSNGNITALAALPGGQLVVGTNSYNSGPDTQEQLSRWDNASWSVFPSQINADVRALVHMPSGELAVGGTFTRVDGNVVSAFTRFSFTGIPTIAQQPSPVSFDEYQTITLTAAPTNGYSGVSVQWFHDDQPVLNGPGGASEGGGIVSGASAELASPTDGSVVTLTITDARQEDSGYYTAVFTNSCGSVTTTPASVDTGATCPCCIADYDRSGGVDPGDIAAFFTDFEAGAACADADEDGGITGGDVALWLHLFEAGGCAPNCD